MCTAPHCSSRYNYIEHDIPFLTSGFWPNRVSHQRNRRRSSENPLVYPAAGLLDSEFLWWNEGIPPTSSFLLPPNSSITGDTAETGATTAVWCSLLYGDIEAFKVVCIDSSALHQNFVFTYYTTFVALFNGYSREWEPV